MERFRMVVVVVVVVAEEEEEEVWTKESDEKWAKINKKVSSRYPVSGDPDVWVLKVSGINRCIWR